MVQENEHSMDEVGLTCQYRGPHGAKCAAGVLIPDELYDPKMEGDSIRGVVADYDLPLFEDVNVNLLYDMQMAHDNGGGDGFTEHMKNRLTHVATRHSLTVPEVKA